MSILSSVTGIGINPFGKRKLKIDPLKALATAATVGSFGSLGPLAGIAGKVGSIASKVPGAAKIGSLAMGAKRVLGGSGVPQVTKGGVPISLSDINPNIPSGGDGAEDGGLLGGLMDFGKKHLGDIGVGALGAADAANAARASKRQGQLSDEALQIAKERWASGAGLREAGTAGLMKPVDFNAVYADPTNPFAQRPAAPAMPLPANRRVLRPAATGATFQ